MSLVVSVFIFFTAIQAWAEENYNLENFVSKYNEVQNSKDSQKKAEKLAKLDFRLRNFIKSLDLVKPEPLPWSVEYNKIFGVYVNHWGSNYEYTGKLLNEAYKLKPKHLRKYMLFAEMHSNDYCWVNNTTNLEAGLQYSKEFLEGPYILDVYFNLGGFYWSLYNDLSALIESNLEKGSLDEPYLMEYIFLPYIKADKASLLEQRKKAKEKALGYWSRYVEKGMYRKEWVENMMGKLESGEEIRWGAFSCPD